MDFTLEENNKDAIIAKLTDEIAKLNKRIDICKESDRHLNKCIDTIRDKYLEQKAENENLKSKIKRVD